MWPYHEAMPFNLVLRGALLDGRLSAVRVSNGLVTEIAPDLRPSGDERALDLGGLALLPGLINAHDHLSLDLLPRVGTPLPSSGPQASPSRTAPFAPARKRHVKEPPPSEWQPRPAR